MLQDCLRQGLCYKTLLNKDCVREGLCYKTVLDKGCVTILSLTRALLEDCQTQGLCHRVLDKGSVTRLS